MKFNKLEIISKDDAISIVITIFNDSFLICSGVMSLGFIFFNSFCIFIILINGGTPTNNAITIHIMEITLSKFIIR